MRFISTLRRNKGSILVLVILVSGVLWFAITRTIASVGDAQRLTRQRVEHERSLMVAQAGLAQGLAWLEKQGTPPTAASTTMAANILNNPDAAHYDIDVKIFYEASGPRALWTVVSTASYTGETGADVEFDRRVQATINQTNFARYEYFVNDNQVWSPGYLHFYGFNQVYFGPMHVNEGSGLWPNLWFVEQATSSAPNGIRYFNDYNTYLNNVYNIAASENWVNIMKYYNATYKWEPKFYKGLSLVPAIDLPAVRSDARATQLRNNSGLNLPAAVEGLRDSSNNLVYDSTKGSKWVVDLIDPSNTNGDGTVQIRQYRGLNTSNQVIYGPAVTYQIANINNAMVVYGDIMSLKGTVDGRLTIGAMRSTDTSTDGNIFITGSVEYQSRKAISNFKYSDEPDLYTSDGSNVNLGYIDTLKTQVNSLDDILGIVSEKEVIVKKVDLSGTPIPADANTTLYLDAIVMATGKATTVTSDGSYYPEDMLNRPARQVKKLGGTIQNKSLGWALFSGGTHTAGLKGPSLWDFRAIQTNGAPPFFPTTGQFEYLPNSWRDTYVDGPNATPVLPTG